jgi:hypothetical protein
MFPYSLKFQAVFFQLKLLSARSDPCWYEEIAWRLLLKRVWIKKKKPWPLFASELYRPSGRRFSAKIVPTFAGRGSAQQIPTAVNLGFLGWCRYLFHSSSSSVVLARLSGSRFRTLLLRKSGRAGNRTRDLWICSQKLRSVDHRGGL